MAVEGEIQRLGAAPSSARDAARARRRPRRGSKRIVSIRSKLRPVSTNAPFARHSRHSSAAMLSATIPEPRPITAAALARLQHQGPDRDIERRFAVRRNPADRAGIDAARRLLEPGDDLHRPDLGSAGDRAAGEDRLDHVDRPKPVLELGGDGRGHLVDGRIGLDREQVRHLDAARPATRATDRCAAGRRSSDFRRAAWDPREAPRRRFVRVRRSRRAAVPFIGRAVEPPVVQREEQLRREGEQPVGCR